MSQVTNQDTDHENENLEAPIDDEEKTANELENDENLLHPDLSPKASDEGSVFAEGSEGVRTDDLEEELAEAQDQLLRAVAETANVRRRAQREKEDAGKYAITNFAREILSVSDNVVRALDSERMEEEKQAKSDLSAAALLERFNNFILGVTMIEAQ